MLPYLEIHREHLILLFGYGGLGFFALTLALGARWYVIGRAVDPEADDQHMERFPDGLKEGHGKVPLFLVALYICTAVWAVCYVAAHAFWGVAFDG